ncbi:leucine-rich repeats and immunoglobulin-like domains protein 3 [Argiope bruennichi]|uniref:leucine-rich repeats and immunoglobulin-like domains protein 3 n=1 Tax=Argiope bruennichi TaxID=94029 RepID=UPI00249563C4|nr:leucine-rich repeats and immunoglobulin-like domains protein 3 [Argiope bruennichi]
MAPFKLIFTSVLVLISVHIMILEGLETQCTGPRCSSTKCPSSCSCLGPLVDCSQRGLIDIPSDLPVWVQNLDLQKNNIGSIDEFSFSGLRNLTELDLSHNQLRIVNSTIFRTLGSLQKLIINHNHLVELPEFGRSLPLEILSVSHNEIHSLNSSVLEDLPKIHTFDLSFNNLVDLPANTFGNSSSLHHLILSHNRLVSLEKGLFDNLTSLETLKLSKNKLSSIPKELFRQLNSLQHLEINSNSLTQIEGLSFQGLASLATLKLRHSGISYLQDGSFYGLSNIKKLQLDNNNIKKVTKGWLYGLNSLQRLFINYNNISEIEDDAWDSGRRLLELDMSFNKLQSISSKSFDKLYALKRLILSDNLITYIEEDSFRSLASLQYLELKNNEVSWIIEDTGKVFAGLVRLKYLGIANNKIKSVVKRAFNGLNRLETLNMTHNEITSIEENAFDDLMHLHELYLNTSSLLCDCNLAWMPKEFHFKAHAVCGYPERLQGISVFEISPTEMVCESSPKPVIIKEPPTKITLKGENVTLECQARSSGNSEMKFHWRKDGKLLQSVRHPTRNFSIRQGNYTLSTSILNIRNIQDEDEGRYQCVISNAFGSVYSGKARITVHVFPVFTKIPADIAIKTGSTARLECGARGQPRPDISWQKDGGIEDFPAARERRMHVMPTDDVFFIVSVKPSDTGVYSCTAQNVAGTIVANATLTVLETPSFVKKMEDKETRAGETTVLECLASGSPRPKLKWTKDGGPLYATERHFFTAGNQLLIIVQTQSSDAGSYTCEMSNTLGTERGSSHLKVLQVNQNGFPVEENHTTTGVIVIAVVICIVGTSIVWVVIIYHTRKRSEEYPQAATSSSAHSSDLVPYSSCSGMCPKEYMKPAGRNMFLDSHSGHSKDSGTGDSGQQSSDDLLLEDDHGLLIEARGPSKFGGIPVVGSLLAEPENGEGSDALREVYVSRNSSMSKEQVPLLQTFRTSLKNSDQLHPMLNEPVQRSFSVGQLGGVPVTLCDPPRESFLRTDSDVTERDSGFSTLPRSITLASVSNWSGDSPRFRRLPKDIPNDSGSFSIGGDEAQELANRCRSITALPTHVIVTSKSCTCVPSAVATKT